MANLNIPNDEDQLGGNPPMYSTNRLKNGDAEKGTLEDWSAISASVIDGGVEGSLKAFKLEPLQGSIFQTIAAAGSQPPDYRVSGSYLPENAVSGQKVDVKAFIKVTVSYADGSKDIVIVPAREATSNGA